MAGDFLGHGQRQCFCLARSLLQKSKLVVLDEVSSSLQTAGASNGNSVDIQTDRIMQAIIRDEFQGCTIISVAHRLNTIVDFDRVVVHHEGRIVESGQPQELLEHWSSLKVDLRSYMSCDDWEEGVKIEMGSSTV
ncbi:ABC transporter integral membrane type 1 [Penicillium fimorum]|uniref:ABC transporter integral membrane type 1 n=1 Tax=Penicillium fimorum TaxID=1882269 RepID=A0A9W9XYN8_9EURO|nr:ABC transporter integral membrane type 1 [Penicillium fimorum]